MSTSDLCPFCSKPLRNGVQQAGKRVCSLCGSPIRKRHKWRIGSDGRLIHKDCSHPTGTVLSIEIKGMFDER